MIKKSKAKKYKAKPNGVLIYTMQNFFGCSIQYYLETDFLTKMGKSSFVLGASFIAIVGASCFGWLAGNDAGLTIDCLSLALLSRILAASSGQCG